MTHRSAFFLALTLLGAACASSSTTGDAPSGVGGHAGAGSGGAHASGGSSSVEDAGMDAQPHDVTDAGALEDAAMDAPVVTDAAMDAPVAEDAGVDAPSTDDASVTGVPTLAVGTITGATSDELVMIASGVTLANDTMKTDCFRAYVLSASWTETNGLTQPQIWDKLCSGTITVNVDMYLGTWYENHVSKTIGYEAEPGTVHMNRYFVDSPYMVADNLIHEGEGHSQGFRHDGVKATSVPYGLNDAFEACSPVGPLPMRPKVVCRALVLFLFLFLLLTACKKPADPLWNGLERHEIQLGQKVLLVKGSRGIVACPYLNIATFTRTGEACAIVPAKDFEGMPAGHVLAVTPAAEALGITVGMSGKEALEKIR